MHKSHTSISDNIQMYLRNVIGQGVQNDIGDIDVSAWIGGISYIVTM